LAFNPGTLTNLALAVVNFRGFSERALVLADNLNGLLATNSPAVAQSASNLVTFSRQLNAFADGLNGVLATNRDGVHSAIANIQASTDTLKALLGEVEAGKGLAGDLLKNGQIASNVSQIAQNLSITTSNLNRLGLWGILWQHKTKVPSEPPPPELKSPKEQSQ
jgi:ABC-type transporter Mla subunit MlaD